VQHYGYRYDYKARTIDHSMRLGELPQWVTCGRRLGKSFLTDADMGGCGHVSGLLVRR